MEKEQRLWLERKWLTWDLFAQSQVSHAESAASYCQAYPQGGMNKKKRKGFKVIILFWITVFTDTFPNVSQKYKDMNQQENVLTQMILEW